MKKTKTAGMDNSLYTKLISKLEERIMKELEKHPDGSMTRSDVTNLVNITIQQFEKEYYECEDKNRFIATEH